MDGEDRALAELAVDVERATMVVDDVLDDGEAEAGAAQFARAPGIDAVEALGEPRQMLARDALAVIAHADGERRRTIARPRTREEARRRPDRDLDRGRSEEHTSEL